MIDTIRLNGIKAYGYTGALPEENILGQWFEAEITLYLDLVRASQSDNLADTCDYRNIIDNAMRILREERFSADRAAGRRNRVNYPGCRPASAAGDRQSHQACPSHCRL